MAWWAWMLLGAGLLALEMFLPGTFFVLFFGVGAAVVGTLVGLGVTAEPWVEWLLFSVVSVASLLAFRGRLLERFSRSRSSTVGTETLMGEVTTLLEDLEPGAVGRGELRGTTWSVRSREERRLSRGERCRVEKVDGLLLWVRAER
jgi:membrane protein implicated in regulation of membrane protease activity